MQRPSSAPRPILYDPRHWGPAWFVVLPPEGAGTRERSASESERPLRGQVRTSAKLQPRDVSCGVSRQHFTSGLEIPVKQEARDPVLDVTSHLSEMYSPDELEPQELLQDLSSNLSEMSSSGDVEIWVTLPVKLETQSLQDPLQDTPCNLSEMSLPVELDKPVTPPIKLEAKDLLEDLSDSNLSEMSLPDELEIPVLVTQSVKLETQNLLEDLSGGNLSEISSSDNLSEMALSHELEIPVTLSVNLEKQDLLENVTGYATLERFVEVEMPAAPHPIQLESRDPLELEQATTFNRSLTSSLELNDPHSDPSANVDAQPIKPEETVLRQCYVYLGRRVTKQDADVARNKENIGGKIATMACDDPLAGGLTRLNVLPESKGRRCQARRRTKREPNRDLLDARPTRLRLRGDINPAPGIDSGRPNVSRSTSSSSRIADECGSARISSNHRNEDSPRSTVDGGKERKASSRPPKRRMKKMCVLKDDESPCSVCGKAFGSEADLATHRETQHMPKKINVCDLCSGDFSTLHDLRQHVMNVHFGTRGFEETVCDDERPASTSSLESHTQVHKAVRRAEFRCDICQRDFRKETNYKEHLLEHSNSKELDCTICGKHFSLFETLRFHVRCHSMEKQFACHLCPMKFKMKFNLAAHVLVHGGSRDFVCEVCGKAFYKSSHLTSHRLTHSTDRKLECGECGKTFKTRLVLKTHMIIHTNVRPYVCAMCGQRFRHHNSLRVHRVKHTGSSGKTYRCIACPRIFTSKKGLENHVLGHMNVRPHVCHKCDKSYITRASLRKHVKVSHGARSHRCNKCNKRFTTFRMLRNHFVSAHGARSHRCDKCNKGFTTKRYLKAHLVSHETERPLGCDHCDKRFKNTSDLKQHVRVHEPKAFRCGSCGKCFQRRAAYNKHCREESHGDNR